MKDQSLMEIEVERCSIEIVNALTFDLRSRITFYGEWVLKLLNQT